MKHPKEIINIWNNLEKKGLDWAQKEACKLAKANPDSVLFQSFYATMLADYSLMYNSKTSAANRRKAVNILKKQIRRLKGVTGYAYILTRNEYYYHTGQHYKQYKCGKEFLESGDKSGHYAIGTGASEYAWELFKKGQYKRAKEYAKISVKSWKKLDGKHSYNLFYSQALLMIGEKKEAYKIYKKISNHKIFRNYKRWLNLYEARFKKIEARGV